MATLTVILVDGAIFAAVLLLLSIGLTLIFGVLRIAASVALGGVLMWVVRGTRFGKLIVSVITDREISMAIGIDVGRMYLVSFTVGALCAALGGALIAPTIAVVPGVAVDVVVL